MKQESPRRPRTALLMSVAVLVATPALAQEVAAPPAAADTTVTPPPVARTVPQGGTSGGTSATPVNPEAAAQAAAEDAERRSTRPAKRAPVRAAAAPARAAAPRAAAPVAAAPAPAAPAPAAPVAQAAPAAPVAAMPAPAEQAQPAADQPAAQTKTSETTTDQGPAMWPLALIALLIVAAGAAFFLLRRRKTEDADVIYEEPVYREPVAVAPVERTVAQPVAAPARAEPSYVAPTAAAAAAGVMVDESALANGRKSGRIATDPVVETAPEATLVSDAAPVAAEDASVAEAHDDDVAALTAADTQGDRPWLEFAMRPVRAGTNVDEVLVEIELTVANAGNIAAEDVRITTFMLPAGNDGEMDRLLTERHDESVTPLTIAAGEGTRVDATLATSRADLAGDTENASFQPVIVADARYRLPDGSEGRTSASFLIGGTPESGTTLDPILLGRPLLREDVEARLYREPARI